MPLECHICGTTGGEFCVRTVKSNREERIKPNGQFATRATLTFGISANALDGCCAKLDEILAELANGFAHLRVLFQYVTM